MSTSSAPQAAAQPAHVRAPRGLLQVLGVGFGLAVIIGNTIGAGILRTPGEVAAQLPSVWIFLGVWVVGGLYALLGAFSISELSAMTPRSGGYYVFTRRALGEFPGFAVGWTDWLAQCGTTAAVSIVIGEYSDVLLRRHLPQYPVLFGREIPIAITVTIGMALLQWRGIRWGSLIQNITSAAKALGFLGLVMAIFALAPQTPEVAPTPLPTGLPLLVALVLAAQAVIYTYDGWYGAIYFGEELRDPARDAPRSTLWGVLSLMAIYVLVNAALVYTLPMSAIAKDKLALGTAAATIFGEWTITVISALMIVSMLSGINAYHLMASRITFAMSRDGLLPPVVARVNPGGTPTTALLLSTVGSVGLTLLPLLRVGEKRPFEDVLAVTTFFFVTDYFLAYLAVFLLRRREPDAPRPYRAWGYPWTTALALAGSLAFLAGALAGDTRNSFYALAVLAGCYPVYLVQRYLRRRD
ncbi:MAG TPA: APC family permease [Terriglobales bacterium]|nr:APC family permease [Terriglobales bacterium]